MSGMSERISHIIIEMEYHGIKIETGEISVIRIPYQMYAPKDNPEIVMQTPKGPQRHVGYYRAMCDALLPISTFKGDKISVNALISDPGQMHELECVPCAIVWIDRLSNPAFSRESIEWVEQRYKVLSGT